MRTKLGASLFLAASSLLGLAASKTEAQGAQTEIEWLEEVAEKPEDSQPKAPGTQSSTDSKGLKLRAGASMFSRYELRRNYAKLEPVDDRINDFDAVAYRARIALRTEPIQLAKGLALELAVVPQASGFWGPSGVNQDAAIALHEGYLRPWFFERAYLQIGRFEMTYGDEWLISANGWHETGRTFDGARFHLGAAKSAAFFDTFVTVLREGKSAAAAQTSNDRIMSGDEILLGMYGDLGPLLSESLHLDPYALLIMAPQSKRYYAEGATTPVHREAAYEATMGLRVAGAYGIVDYRVEGGIQFGERTNDALVQDTLAGAVDGELGFNLPATIRIAAGGNFASGDDPTTRKNEGWADRFSQPHKWLGLTDMFRSRTNVLGPTASLSVAPIDGLDFGVQGHFLFKHRVLSSDPTAAKPDVDAKYAGTEIDPYLGYTLAKGLSLRSEYGVYIPAHGVYGDQKAAHYFGLQFGYENPG